MSTFGEDFNYAWRHLKDQPTPCSSYLEQKIEERTKDIAKAHDEMLQRVLPSHFFPLDTPQKIADAKSWIEEHGIYYTEDWGQGLSYKLTLHVPEYLDEGN